MDKITIYTDGSALNNGSPDSGCGWTCRVGERLQEAVEWCRGYGLEFDAVNENLPEIIECFGTDTRKVCADIYIDDKMVKKPKYHVPYKEVAE